MPTATSTYHDILETHRSKLVRLAEKRGVNRLRELYDRSQEQLAAKLRRTSPGRKTSFTAHQQRALLGQIQQGQQMIAARLAGELGDLSREAQVESLRGLGTWLGRMEKHYGSADIDLPIDEAARFWGVVDKRRSSLLKQHETSMATYGAHIVGKMEKDLGLSLMQGETIDGAIDRVQKVADVEWWKAEQIVRTEISFATNATHYDGIAAAAEEIDDLYLRWVEHVTDSGQPMDDRVGADSLVLHGQVTKPDGWFEMPRDPRVSQDLWGKTWQFPPSRPNDRAVLAAWRPHWGGYAYRMVGNRRVPMRAK
jgi:hypothetical protein